MSQKLPAKRDKSITFRLTGAQEMRIRLDAARASQSTPDYILGRCLSNRPALIDHSIAAAKLLSICHVLLSILPPDAPATSREKIQQLAADVIRILSEADA